MKLSQMSIFTRPAFQGCCGACCIGAIPEIEEEAKFNWLDYNEEPFKGVATFDLTTKKNQKEVLRIFKRKLSIRNAFTFLFFNDKQNELLGEIAIEHFFLYLGKGPHSKNSTVDVHGYVRILEKANGIFAKSL